MKAWCGTVSSTRVTFRLFTTSTIGFSNFLFRSSTLRPPLWHCGAALAARVRDFTVKPESAIWFRFHIVCEIHSESEMCEMPYADRINNLGARPPDPRSHSKCVRCSAQHHPSQEQDRCALTRTRGPTRSVAPSREVSPMPMRPLELPKVKRVRVEPPPRATRDATPSSTGWSCAARGATRPR